MNLTDNVTAGSLAREFLIQQCSDHCRQYWGMSPASSTYDSIASAIDLKFKDSSDRLIRAVHISATTLRAEIHCYDGRPNRYSKALAQYDAGLATMGQVYWQDRIGLDYDDLKATSNLLIALWALLRSDHTITDTLRGQQP